MERELRVRLCRLIGGDPDGKAIARWCDEIGRAGVERAIKAAEQGRRPLTACNDRVIQGASETRHKLNIPAGVGFYLAA